MSTVLARIQELEARRAQLNSDIDREVEGLKAQAQEELDKAREAVARLEAVLKPTQIYGAEKPMFPPEKKAPKVMSDLDYTDAGRGVGEEEASISAQSFKDELALLRERTQAKQASAVGMSIQQQAKVAELERRVEALERMVQLLTERKTLSLPKKPKAN